MLTLNDGRSELWQWDTGRKLNVGADCSQVHFSNKVFGRSIDVDVVNGVAIIPDVLLQTEKDLNAWAFVGTAENGYTKISKVFKVNRRNKPADYVFTPTEQTTLDGIVERVSALEENWDPNAIKNAVGDYFEENPVLTEEKDPTVPAWAKKPQKPQYTAQEVGALPDDTPIPKIPENVSSFKNDAGYLTEHQDLSDYAKKDEIPAKPSDIGAQPAGNYALRSELPVVPTKVSAFENDKGYLTQHQDISGKLDANKLPEAINDALAQAKESGEFDGADGKNGSDGTSVTVSKVTESTADGGSNVVTFSDGKTVTIKNGSKGSTGATGDKGDKGDTGAAGTNGVSCTHSWNGTTLSVTSASGTSSANLKGEKGDKGDTGATGANGTNGKDGADGKTPVKGTDYWTAADKSAMVSDVLAALPTWNGGSY